MLAHLKLLLHKELLTVMPHICHQHHQPAVLLIIAIFVKNVKPVWHQCFAMWCKKYEVETWWNALEEEERTVWLGLPLNHFQVWKLFCETALPLQTDISQVKHVELQNLGQSPTTNTSCKLSKHWESQGLRIICQRNTVTALCSGVQRPRSVH